MHRKFMWAALLGLSVAFVSATQANTVFDFRQASQQTANYQQTSGGIQVTVTALDTHGNPGGLVNVDSTYGLGVVGDASDQTVDGPMEELIFNFNPAITLNSVTYDLFTFAPNNGGDNSTITMILLNSSQQVLFSSEIPANGFVDLSGFTVAQRTGATLLITDDGGQGNDNFAVQQLSVDATTSTPAVPLPSSAYAGLSLLAILACRKLPKMVLAHS